MAPRGGIGRSFPVLVLFPENKITQNKSALIQLMDVFDEKYPGQGLLVVVDEMLDDLRSRKDTELVHDLSFLARLSGPDHGGSQILRDALTDHPPGHGRPAFDRSAVHRRKD